MRRTLRLLQRLGEDDTFFPIEIVQRRLDAAWRLWKTVSKDPDTFRQDFQDGLAEAMADSQDIPKLTALNNIQHREAQRASSSTIRYVLKRLHGGGISMVVVDINGIPTELTSKTAIEEALIEEHLRKYHQTEGFSPLLIGQLLQDIGLLGDGPRAHEILNGSYVAPEGTPEGTRLYLESLIIPDGLNRSRREFGLSDFSRGWKKNERTYFFTRRSSFWTL